eukprot:6211736-Pleurochrysis_carterae.AAC.2
MYESTQSHACMTRQRPSPFAIMAITRSSKRYTLWGCEMAGRSPFDVDKGLVAPSDSQMARNPTGVQSCTSVAPAEPEGV